MLPANQKSGVKIRDYQLGFKYRVRSLRTQQLHHGHISLKSKKDLTEIVFLSILAANW